MVDGKKILQFFGIFAVVLVITFAMSWVELLSRAKESYNEVIQLIEKAFLLKDDVRKYIVNHSWEYYAKKIEDLFLE